MARFLQFQVTLIEEGTQVPPPSPQLVDTLKIVTVVTSAADGDNKGENMLNADEAQ
jgi:hypothetical protein